MTCRFTLTRLAELADGVLSAEDLAAVQAHTAVCPACTRFIAGYLAMSRIAKHAGGNAPPELIDRVLGRR